MKIPNKSKHCLWKGSLYRNRWKKISIIFAFLFRLFILYWFVSNRVTQIDLRVQKRYNYIQNENQK